MPPESPSDPRKSPDRFLDRPIARLRFPAADAPFPHLGQELGCWTLLEPLGEGGMAKVYRARRSDGLFEREVAIKLARQDLGPESLERFERERRVLAQLEHPGIARLYDGGLTPEGRPFLVMERIEGLTIDRHCTETGASRRERAELVAQVAEAVEAAHERGIVHRDVKPANVLVDPAGRAVLLDFGIAKLLDPDGGLAHGLRTRTNERPMTPLWASPEQVTGAQPTAASDVYSLGVLLYYLLCGETPYRLETDSLTELERAILEQEPAAPSLRGAQQSRGRWLGFLRRREAGARQGVLDTVVLRALAKRPRDRYSSAGLLAADLRRWVQGESIVAAPRSFADRLHSTVARQRRAWPAWVAAATLAGVGVLWTNLERVDRDRLRSEAHAERMRNREIGMALNLSSAPASGEFAAEDLERGVSRLEAAEDPLFKAAAIETAAEVFHQMGRIGRAGELFGRAVELRQQLGGPSALETIEAEEKLATVLQELGQLERAEALFRHVLAVRIEELGDGHVETAMARNNLGVLLWESERYDEAEAVLGRSLEIARLRLGENHAATISALGNLALTLEAQGRRPEAEQLYRRQLAAIEETLGGGHLRWAESANRLSTLLRREQRYPEALLLARKVVEVFEHRLGPEHLETATALDDLGLVHFDTFEQLEEAKAAFRRAFEIRLPTLAPDHPALENSRRQLALVDLLLEAKASDFAADPHVEL